MHNVKRPSGAWGMLRPRGASFAELSHMPFPLFHNALKIAQSHMCADNSSYRIFIRNRKGLKPHLRRTMRIFLRMRSAGEKGEI